MGLRRTTTVLYDHDDSSQLGRLPQVHSGRYFDQRRQHLNKIHDAIVEVGSAHFKVFGWTKADLRGVTNYRLRQIKPSTVWRGEVMVLCLGTRRPFLSRPYVAIRDIERVASM